MKIIGKCERCGGQVLDDGACLQCGGLPTRKVALGEEQPVVCNTKRKGQPNRLYGARLPGIPKYGDYN